MKDTMVLFTVAALLAVAAAEPAAAQGARGRFTLPSKPPRVAVQKPRTQTVIVTQRTPVRPSYPAHPVAFTLLPAVVMSDGRVFADFGYGYEPVSRACAASGYQTTTVLTGSQYQIPVVGANGTLLNGNTQPAPRMAPPPRMATNPNQPAAAAAQTSVSRVASSSCYRREATRTVVVIH